MTFLILITGPSSSGKTTLAKTLLKELRRLGKCALHMDGIDFRRMVKNENFTKDSIETMEDFILNFTEVLSSKDLFLIYSLVAHRRSFRERLKNTSSTFHVHLSAPIKVLKRRDEKGVYERAEKGEMFLAGYSESFEEPIEADILFDTSRVSLEEELKIVLKKLKERGILDV